MSAANWGMGGRGAKYFFSGPKCPPRLDNGNEWRKFRAAPRLYPLRSLVCTLFYKGESRGALDYQERAGIMSIVRWNLRPVVFGACEISNRSQFLHGGGWCLRASSPRPPGNGTLLSVSRWAPSVREIKDTVRVSLQEYLFTGSSKVSFCGFWQKRVRLSDLLEGGLPVLQEPTLTVLLVLPIL